MNNGGNPMPSSEIPIAISNELAAPGDQEPSPSQDASSQHPSTKSKDAQILGEIAQSEKLEGQIVEGQGRSQSQSQAQPQTQSQDPENPSQVQNNNYKEPSATPLILNNGINSPSTGSNHGPATLYMQKQKQKQGTPVWTGSLTWTAQGLGVEKILEAYVEAISINAADCHSDTWPTSLRLVPTTQTEIPMDELQTWLKRHQPALCILQVHGHPPVPRMTNEYSYQSLIQMLTLHEMYATASWTTPSGGETSNVLIFKIGGIGLAAAFFPLTGVPGLSQPSIPSDQSPENLRTSAFTYVLSTSSSQRFNSLAEHQRRNFQEVASFVMNSSAPRLDASGMRLNAVAGPSQLHRQQHQQQQTRLAPLQVNQNPTSNSANVTYIKLNNTRILAAEQLQKLEEDIKNAQAMGDTQSADALMAEYANKKDLHMKYTHAIAQMQQGALAEVQAQSRSQPQPQVAEVAVWTGSLNWSGVINIQTFIVATTSGNPAECYSNTWPKALHLVPAKETAVSLPELQQWMTHHKPAFCILRVLRTQDPESNGHNYQSLVEMLITKKLYATAAWATPSGRQTNNVLIFPVNRVILAAAFFPLTGLPELPKVIPAKPPPLESKPDDSVLDFPSSLAEKLDSIPEDQQHDYIASLLIRYKAQKDRQASAQQGLVPAAQTELDDTRARDAEVASLQPTIPHEKPYESGTHESAEAENSEREHEHEHDDDIDDTSGADNAGPDQSKRRDAESEC